VKGTLEGRSRVAGGGEKDDDCERGNRPEGVAAIGRVIGENAPLRHKQFTGISLSRKKGAALGN